MSLTHLLATAVVCAGPSSPAPSAPEPLVDSAPLTLSYTPTAIESVVSLTVFQDDETSAEPAEAPAEDPLADGTITLPPAFGAKGTRRWYVQGAYGTHARDNNSMWLGGVGFSHFIFDGLSIDLEFNGVYFNQGGGDAYGFNFNILFRWHFIRERRWSFYADAGAGVLFTNDHVPPDGSSYNFTPQAGVGFTHDIGRDMRLMLGLRWYHVSNANLDSDNPGADYVVGYAGVSFAY